MNKTLSKAARGILFTLLSQCTVTEQLTFNAMYFPKDYDSKLSVKEMSEQLGDDKLDHAISQCENTLVKKEVRNIVNSKTDIENIIYRAILSGRNDREIESSAIASKEVMDVVVNPLYKEIKRLEEFEWMYNDLNK